MMTQPNYEHCAKMEYWGLNTAALLLSDICPITHRSVRVMERDIPSEFEGARELCYLLKSVSWETNYKDYYIKGKGIRPAAVISFAKSKKINIPSALLENVEMIYEDELSEINNICKRTDKKVNTELGSRERKTWQLGTALLVRLYAKKINKISQDNEVDISASQLLQSMLDEAERLGLSADGIKSFDRKIINSLELLDEEKSN
jgi:hypothetical protein